MKRQLQRLLRQFMTRILPFCLGLLLVGVQIGPSLAKAPVPVLPNPTGTSAASPQPENIQPEDNGEFTVPELADPELPAPIDAMQKSPEERLRFNRFVEADRLYIEGQRDAAAAIYRELKPSFDGDKATEPRPTAVMDIAQMPPAAKVYWRESTAGLQAKLEGRTFVPLKLLVQEYPQFIPGHLRLAQAYEDYAQPVAALKVLQNASTLYPNNTELLALRIQALARNEQWMEGAIAARQFALLNPDHPEVEQFTQLADENLTLYRKNLRQKLTGNVVGNVITGALGYALTGSLFGPLNSLQTSFLMLRGESAIGDSVARRAKDALDLVTDEATNQYVNEIGMKLAAVAGREDFQYEFVVVKEPDLNAFALPGGKVFINAGAIAKTNSEAELAGLVGHEIAHAVLAHGLQLMTQGSLTANITQFIPYVGGLAESVITFSYSRDMERQADALGTRLLAAAGYASDGVWNLMQALNREEADRQRSRPPQWLSSHPGGNERLKNVEKLITQVGYNRYAYEGVERHALIQRKMVKLLETVKQPGQETGKIIDQRDGKNTEIKPPVPSESAAIDSPNLPAIDPPQDERAIGQ